jgi:hypothetical protein
MAHISAIHAHASDMQALWNAAADSAESKYFKSHPKPTFGVPLKGAYRCSACVRACVRTCIQRRMKNKKIKHRCYHASELFASRVPQFFFVFFFFNKKVYFLLSSFFSDNNKKKTGVTTRASSGAICPPTSTRPALTARARRRYVQSAHTRVALLIPLFFFFARAHAGGTKRAHTRCFAYPAAALSY